MASSSSSDGDREAVFDYDELNSFKDRTPAQLGPSRSDEPAVPRPAIVVAAAPAATAATASTTARSSSKTSERPRRSVTGVAQARALMIKSFHVQRRSKGTICCQLIVPVILVVMVGLIQIMFNVILNKNYTAGQPVIGSATDLAFSQSTYEFNQFTLPATSPPQLRPALGELYANGSKSGMLGNIAQVEGLDFVLGGQRALLPNFYWADSQEQVVQWLYARKLASVNEGYANLQSPTCLSCPASYAFFQNTTSMRIEDGLSYIVGADTQLNYYHTQTQCTVINMIDNAYAKALTQNQSSDRTPPIITTQIQPLPYLSRVPIFDVGSTAATFLFPFAVSFLLPVFMNDIVMEKEERLRSMMVMAGLKMRLYWLVTYLYNMLLFLVVYLLLILVCVLFRLRFVTETSPTLLFLLFFGWGNAQIAFAFFLSCFFNTARVASVVGYCMVIASVLICYLLNVTIFDPNTLPLWVFMLYPPFPFYRSIFIIGLECGFFDCTTWSDLSSEPDSQLVWMTVWLYAVVPIYLLLTAYFDRVFPSDTGLRSHPLFFLKPLLNCFRRLRSSPPPTHADDERTPLLPSTQRRSVNNKLDDDDDSNEQIEDASAAQLLSEDVDPLYSRRHDDDDDDERLDEEVLQEKLTIERGKLSELVAGDNMVLCNLRKTYSNGKSAVRGVSVLIARGETFGLLGNNGAGKSTTISMLTGLFAPSSGTAYLCGYDIRSEMDDVNRIMGVCPQFDCLWKELSVEETLQFYARIKGVPRHEEQAHTARILHDIGLAHCPRRLVKELSGGMMRRLSVGIAIAADPRLIFLDEPTTGLDPVSRAELWDVLLRVKQDRCVVLTTHSMSEADALCNRIAIMSDGQLQCIGTSLHLKRRFGQGYSLLVQVALPQQLAAVTDFVVADICPDATLRSRFDRTVTYELPAGSIDVSHVFQRLTEASPRLGISDFGLSLSTLTDVFLRVSKDSSGQSP